MPDRPWRGRPVAGAGACDTTLAGGGTDLFGDGFATAGTGQWSGVAP